MKNNRVLLRRSGYAKAQEGGWGGEKYRNDMPGVLNARKSSDMAIPYINSWQNIQSIIGG
jgi:hypothetical protein